MAVETNDSEKPRLLLSSRS